MKAHDVRHLMVCECGDLLDDREAINTGAAVICGKCAFKALGIKGALALPKSELGKFRLDHVGPEVMMKLCQ
jgi:hypothetical protein